MPKQRKTAVATEIRAPNSRRSLRARRATKRFVERWFSARLPRLSMALRVGMAGQQEAPHTGAEGGPSSNDDTGHSTDNSHTHDETHVPGHRRKVRRATAVAATRPQRSYRVRKATKRFVNGGSAGCLPRLSSALGVAVATRQGRQRRLV